MKEEKITVTSIAPGYLNIPNARKYVSMGRDLFKKNVMESGIRIYASGKKTFYKVSDLDKMMEGLIIKKQTA